MKKEKKILGIFLFALVAVLATMTGALAAGTFTLNRPADGAYSNSNNTIWINITWSTSDNPIAWNATNITFVATNSSDKYVANGSFNSVSATKNNSLNLSSPQFIYQIGSDRTVSFYFNVTNATGELLQKSATYTYIYDTTNPNSISLAFDKTTLTKRQSFVATASATDTNGISTYRYALYNPSGSIVTEKTGSTATFTNTDFVNTLGKYTIKMNATDPASNTGTSDTYTITVNSGTETEVPVQEVLPQVQKTPEGNLVVKKDNTKAIVMVVFGVFALAIIIFGAAYAMKKGKKRKKK